MLKIEIERQNAEVLLAALQRRLEVIHHIEAKHPERLTDLLKDERAALVPTIVAIEQALKRPPCQ